MTILSDKQILQLCEDQQFITPYVTSSVRQIDQKKVLSFGPSSYGYDVRCTNRFYIYSSAKQANKPYIDPKDFQPDCYEEYVGDFVLIPPNGFILTNTVEYFKMPRNVTGLVLGKSTLARSGVACLATPLEAGWEGSVVLEFANTSPWPMKFYANEGCAQVLFFEGEPCEVSYADRAGKYQGQTGITLPKV